MVLECIQFRGTAGPGHDWRAGAADRRCPSVGPVRFRVFWTDAVHPTAILNAMVTSRDSKLLASPQIAVLNDQDASIFIGDTLRFQSLAVSGPNTGNQFTVVE